jgi:class 3 adenylate cyclase/tetratricopeptide (TPR) repeat protein
MAEIFVSHARSTAAQALRIAAELRSAGYEVWIDDQLPVHRAYTDVIEENLRAARVVLVIWSTDAVKSNWVRAEAGVGLDAGTLVQMSLDGVDLPLPFNQIECAKLVGWTGDPSAAGWKKVLSSIEELTSHRDRKPDLAKGPELRRLTMLSCGLIQTKNAVVSLGPEAWHGTTARYGRRSGEVVAQFGGYVVKNLGNNVVACFGYPTAQENAAERAARAGFAIIDAIHELNDQSAAEDNVAFAAQIGIHAGTVLVGFSGDEETFGDIPEIAAQAQRSALPNSVVITSAIHDVLIDTFVMEKHHVERATWNERPIDLYRVVSTTRVRARARRPAPRERAFVGRDDELQLLASRWTRVGQGHGQMVLMIGEPGIGKTRLTEEFAERLESHAHTCIWCRGEQLRANTPFYAAARMLEQTYLDRGDEAPEQQVARLEEVLSPSGVDLAEGVPLLAETLGLDLRHMFPKVTLSGAKLREKVLEILAAWLLGAAQDRPIVLVIEDLQWLDPSTLELVEILVDQGATAPLLLLCTARPDFRPPWSMRVHHAQITLDRLSDDETRALVNDLSEPPKLGRRVVDAIVERAGGVPLFAAELVLWMLSRGDRVGAREIPLTLQDLLAARLDRLGSARYIAQLGAVLGRMFSYDLLHAISGMREADVQFGLAVLANAELIHVRGRFPNAQCVFTHALIQEAAYQTLVADRRRLLHARVATTILAREPALAEEHPEVVAEHWSGAGEVDKAIDAWSKAAKFGSSRFAYKETVQILRSALALLATVQETRDREELALQLHSSLIGALQITCGYSASETREATRIALQLAERRGDVEAQFRHTNGEWMAASSAGDYPTSAVHAERLLSLARALGSPRELAAAHMALLTTRVRTGDLIDAERLFAAGARYFESETFMRLHGAAAQTYGNAAINALIMGNEVEARRRIEFVHQTIRTNANPYNLAFSQHMAGLLDFLMGDLEGAEQRAIESIKRSVQGEFPQFAAISSILLGRVRAEAGHPEEGLAHIKEGLTLLTDTGNRAAITQYLNWCAATYAQCGSWELALKTIDDALTVNPYEICHRAESLRMRAEFRLKKGDREGAWEDLKSAIELAQSIGAVLYAQRAIAVRSRDFPKARELR